MSVFSLCFSPTGGTAKVAHILMSVWDRCEEIDLSEPDGVYSRFRFAPEDVCYISFPVFEGRVPGLVLERLGQMKGNGAAAVLVAVYGNRAINDALLELKNETAGLGFQPFAAVGAVAAHSIQHRYAAGRPDAVDTAELSTFAQQIKTAVSERNGNETLAVPGKQPYIVLTISRQKPKADDTCTNCGLCAARCPVSAIPREAPSKTGADICIGCMRCVSICPVQARSIDQKLVAERAEKLRPYFEGRKPNALYLPQKSVSE